MTISIQYRILDLVQVLNQALQFYATRKDALWRLLTLVIVTFFTAKAMNLLIAHKFFPLELQPTNRENTFSGASTAQRQVNISAIVTRNLFNSEKKGPGPKGAIPEDELVPTTLNIDLIGTIVFRNSRFSVGLVRDKGTNKSEYFGVGEPLQSAVVSRVERFRIILENNGRMEFAEIRGAESKLHSSRALNPGLGVPMENSGSGELEEIAPNQFIIPKTLLDDTLSNFSKVLTQARMVPNLTDDNRTDGFKVFQIKPGSIYEKLGMKDNDIIKRVNGQDLDSFEKATGLFTALRNEKVISIDVVRGGARLNYTYEIR